MKKLVLLPLFFVIVFSINSQKLSEPILLWPQGAPGATGTSDEDKPALIPFVPEPAKATGAAILVVPGGGFTIRAVDHEGVLVAQWLRSQGIAAFLLRYRLRPIYERAHWLADGQRAMQYIRAHAGEYALSKERIGAIGFSAGATLIADMALNPVHSISGDALDAEPHRPNFLVLAYGGLRPVAGSILGNMPPTFMYGTVEDRSSMNTMQALYGSLYQAQVPVEAHFFQTGIHGTGFALGDPNLGQWPKLMLQWIKQAGFLCASPKVSFTGQVNLDASPLLKGMLIFKPIQNKNAPDLTVYLNNTGTGPLGAFNVDEKYGPVAGKYAVELRQDATRWTSNSRDPFMITMMDKQSKNSLSEQDKQDWAAYLRKRNLSPSIENQRVFKYQRPGHKKPYVVDIKANSHLIFDFFSK